MGILDFTLRDLRTVSRSSGTKNLLFSVLTTETFPLRSSLRLTLLSSSDRVSLMSPATSRLSRPLPATSSLPRMLRDGSTCELPPLPDTSTCERRLVLANSTRCTVEPSTEASDLLTTRMLLDPSTDELSRLLRSSVSLRPVSREADESPRTDSEILTESPPRLSRRRRMTSKFACHDSTKIKCI